MASGFDHEKTFDVLSKNRPQGELGHAAVIEVLMGDEKEEVG